VSSALEACRERHNAELEAIRADRASDAKVAGYLCQAFPAPVVAGLGLRPLRLHCGVSSRSMSDGERHLRADACPLVKSLLGNISSKHGFHAEVDIWAGLLTCDQMRRAIFMLSDEFGLEVHPIQLPATRSMEAAHYYAGQVKRFISDIEKLHGLRFDPEKALSWHDASMAAASVLTKAARSMDLSPLLLHAMFHLYFICRPYGLAEFFEELITSEPSFHCNSRMVVTGSPVAYEDTVLFEVLDEAGVSALPLNCTGLNAIESDKAAMSSITDDDRQVEHMALEAFWRAPCARARPNTSMHERLKDNVRTSGATGVILKCLKFCDLWHTEHIRMGKGLDVPLLVLDSVYAEGERERLRSRVEAFVETLA
jgi:benzoyl-CoA reductase/2-hydroxyglutaryl-CoA dehydratase subunit BcrC/BadD/HgdB